MNGDISLPNAIGLVLWHMVQVLFQWIPATAAAIAGTNGTDTYGSVPSFINPIPGPVTITDISTFLQASAGSATYDQVLQTWGGFVAVSYTVSIILVMWLTYSIMHLRRIRKTEALAFAQKLHSITHKDVPQTQLRWHRILEYIHSDNEQSWRLAILEADVMLGELLDTLGYKGHTMTEKMRKAERLNFNSIDHAWEAHRMRNHIVHAGESVHIDVHTARKTIATYEHVFKEFHFLP